MRNIFFLVFSEYFNLRVCLQIFTKNKKIIIFLSDKTITIILLHFMRLKFYINFFFLLICHYIKNIITVKNTLEYHDVILGSYHTHLIPCNIYSISCLWITFTHKQNWFCHWNITNWINIELNQIRNLWLNIELIQEISGDTSPYWPTTWTFHKELQLCTFK